MGTQDEQRFNTIGKAHVDAFAEAIDLIYEHTDKGPLVEQAMEQCRISFEGILEEVGLFSHACHKDVIYEFLRKLEGGDFDV